MYYIATAPLHFERNIADIALKGVTIVCEIFIRKNSITMKFNYFIYLKHTTNTTEFILGFIRFYVPCSSTLIMEEYEMLSCVRGYHE